MSKLSRGPNSLTPVIGKALEADPPAWDTIVPQTQEYARLAADGQERTNQGDQRISDQAQHGLR